MTLLSYGPSDDAKTSKFLSYTFLRYNFAKLIRTLTRKSIIKSVKNE